MNEAGPSGDGLGDGERGFCSMSYKKKRKSQEWRSGHSRRATTSSQRRRGLLWGGNNHWHFEPQVVGELPPPVLSMVLNQRRGRQPRGLTYARESLLSGILGLGTKEMVGGVEGTENEK